MNVYEELIKLKDDSYKQFHSKLMPTVNPDTVIGIRTPVLRKFAKEFFKCKECDSFLSALPHYYYEENNLHAFLIEQIKDYDEAILKTEKFLPYINNWATCDMFQPKIFKKNKDKIIDRIYLWLQSDKTYTVRYAINQLMNLYLDENFKPEYMQTVSKITSNEYYINMMISWYFATAMAKQEKYAKYYIENSLLPVWVHNKTIQKCVESNRISDDLKEYLKTLKIK